MNFDIDFSDLLESLNDGVYITDKERRIIFWNKAAERITGYPVGQMVGAHCHQSNLQHVDEEGTNLCAGLCPLAHTLVDAQTREETIFLQHKDGHRVPVISRVTALYDRSGRLVGAAEFFTDVSEHYSALERMQELAALALLDPLTRLSNRTHVEEEIQARFQEQERYGLAFGVLFLDIDNFKLFNDHFGHDAGDQALKIVAETLRYASRTFDVIGRWGGEEFVGVLRSVEETGLKKIAERYRALVSQTMVPLAAGKQRVTISIGGTLARPGDTLESVVRRADQMMYRSKKAGRNRVTVG